MAQTTVSKNSSFSETFYSSLFDVTDGERIRTCLQCATCSGACPVAQVTNGRYNPRRLILDALLGLKDKIFGEEK